MPSKLKKNKKQKIKSSLTPPLLLPEQHSFSSRLSADPFHNLQVSPWLHISWGLYCHWKFTFIASFSGSSGPLCRDSNSATQCLTSGTLHDSPSHACFMLQNQYHVNSVYNSACLVWSQPLKVYPGSSWTTALATAESWPCENTLLMF